MTTTTDVQNYPGYSDVIQGPWLMDQMKEQAKAVGTDMIQDHINKVDLSKKPFKAIGDSGQEYTADSIIISTGAQARWLNLESEQKYRGYGVSGCATCDGFFFRDQEIAVVGGGDSALEEAGFLTRFASKVTLVHRRDNLRASKIMQRRAFDNPKIEFAWNTVVDDILGDSKVEALDLRDTMTGKSRRLPVTGVFIAIGHRPNTDLFTGQLDMDEAGYLITGADRSTTNVEGGFACGDVQDHTYRQAVTAASSGCMAALDAERWLESRAD